MVLVSCLGCGDEDGRTEFWNLVLLDQLRGQRISFPGSALRIDAQELINSTHDTYLKN